MIEETINNNSKTKAYNYGANGNITSIENGGYHLLKYQSSKPNALSDHKFENTYSIRFTVPSTATTEHEYTYTKFDKIQHIEQSGEAMLDMEYGIDQQRIHMQVAEYGNITIDNYYVNSANLEIKNGIMYTYLYAEGKPFAIHKSNTEELYYLHLDNQGSLMAISDITGNVIENRSYDAWGRPRNPDNWEYDQSNTFGGGGFGITTRGYTMHEHLEMFNLINMNGRLYDPLLGRMLSPDNYIQSPNSTQSYNRYSYCINNPLKYTDPSGNVYEGYTGPPPIDPNSFYNYKQDPFFTSIMNNYYNSYNCQTNFQSGMAQLQSFSNWLSQNGSLVSSISPSMKNFYNFLEFNGIIMNSDERILSLNDKTLAAPGTILLNEVVIHPKINSLERNFTDEGGDFAQSNGGWDNSKIALDIGGGIYGALETASRPGNQWAGKNGKYYNNSWGGNQYTGSRSGAFKAASAYKWAGRATVGVSAIIGVAETVNGYQMDGGQFGYNAQSAAFGSAGSIAGGWAGAEAGAWSFGIAGGLIGGPPGAVVGAVIGGFVGGFGGGYLGGNIGSGSVNYYHGR